MEAKAGEFYARGSPIGHIRILTASFSAAESENTLVVLCHYRVIDHATRFVGDRKGYPVFTALSPLSVWHNNSVAASVPQHLQTRDH
jgi:hypothetical protein